MQIQTSTVEVVTTSEVQGIFLTAAEVQSLSYPLYNLVIDMAKDVKKQFPSYGNDEREAVIDFKAMIDNFLGQ